MNDKTDLKKGNSILAIVKQYVDSLKRNGMFSIVMASIVNKVIALILSVIIVRIISKFEYGLYSEAFNTCSLFLIFSGLGVKNGVLQFCCEERTIQSKYVLYKFGLFFGVAVNMLITILIFVYAILSGMSTIESQKLLFFMLSMPIINFTNEYGLVWLRTRLENKQFARATNIQSIFNLLLSVSGAWTFGVEGYIIGQVAATGVSSFYIFLLGGRFNQWKSIINSGDNFRYLDSEKKKLLKFSLTCTITNALSSLLVYLDVFLLGKMFQDPLILAAYKASSTIPEAAKFLTSTIIICIYPVFVRNSANTKWLTQSIKKMTFGLMIFNGAITCCLYFGADLIVRTIYGSQYLDAVPVFKLLSISFFFATVVRIPFGNILLMLREEKFNFLLAAISGTLNIVLDIVLIQKYGSVGAAVATMLVVIISGLLSLVRVIWKIEKNKKSIEI